MKGYEMEIESKVKRVEHVAGRIQVLPMKILHFLPELHNPTAWPLTAQPPLVWRQHTSKAHHGIPDIWLSDESRSLQGLLLLNISDQYLFQTLFGHRHQWNELCMIASLRLLCAPSPQGIIIANIAHYTHPEPHLPMYCRYFWLHSTCWLSPLSMPLRILVRKVHPGLPIHGIADGQLDIIIIEYKVLESIDLHLPIKFMSKRRIPADNLKVPSVSAEVRNRRRYK